MVPSSSESPSAPGGDRIAKVLARAGVCSRREAERMIAAGRVAIDGTLLETPARTVQPGERVTVDGQPIPEAEETRVWRYHKPPGLVTTNRDPQGRPTVFENLPAELPRVMTVGRLDLNSEGLLLLTNDGALARHLEHPDTAWIRRYRVRVHGQIDPDRLGPLERGVDVNGVRYGPIKAALERQQGANAWLTVALREGRNREIRHVMEFLGWPVTRLIRVGYGPFILGPLPRQGVEEVARRHLRDTLGATWKTAGPKRPRHRARRDTSGDPE
ncbi:rRNA pseudouridine synthase [Roseospira marina]|uniref:Pseudouridine synthase n=1 Tax=Roseospira marina TaxID=140057 RepID=A0A5M6I8X1_9PROT|nr:pseudouridine synthase [Roseospira marina]KAA5604686.1 rRNA pseudouridine synthase [Roseospira marina]MBB4315133.1 23S rRNA pseudouridine2605 synthase [Roseospira marina]MBB5088097.1 23S rRNA pseudouridine2605 synthase [Roseospira marina]